MRSTFTGYQSKIGLCLVYLRWLAFLPFVLVVIHRWNVDDEGLIVPNSISYDQDGFWVVWYDA